MKLDEFELHEFGNTITLSGMMLSDARKQYLLPFPEEQINDIVSTDIEILDLSLEDWKTVLRQTDVLETVVLASDKNGLKKATLRKSGRQIDQRVSWAVYRRDNYTCRYCGRNDVPLTVDHLILWEVGGPSIEENLVSSCKSCNKARGNTEYEEWINSDFYLNVCEGLSYPVIEKNEQLVHLIKTIPVRVHKISRGSKKKKKRR